MCVLKNKNLLMYRNVKVKFRSIYILFIFKCILKYKINYWNYHIIIVCILIRPRQFLEWKHTCIPATSCFFFHIYFKDSLQNEPLNCLR